MQKGSYIWNVTVETKWDYQDESEDFEKNDYTVSSPSFEKACSKVLNLASKETFNKKWSDTQEDGKVKTFEVERFEIVSVVRGDWIDG